METANKTNKSGKIAVILITLLLIGAAAVTGIIWNCNFACGISGQSPHRDTSDINNPICKTAVRFSMEKNWIYDAGYYVIPYPNGDVPSGGACTDVIIRVLRDNGMDLQQLIHEDMLTAFDQYPHNWGLTAPDPNIDHRRVPNIMKYFERKGYDKPRSSNVSDYYPGDIVMWELSPGITHTGICLGNGDIYHNIGPSARIDEGILFNYRIIGHYRIPDLHS